MVGDPAGVWKLVLEESSSFREFSHQVILLLQTGPFLAATANLLCCLNSRDEVLFFKLGEAWPCSSIWNELVDTFLKVFIGLTSFFLLEDISEHLCFFVWISGLGDAALLGKPVSVLDFKLSQILDRLPFPPSFSISQSFQQISASVVGDTVQILATSLAFQPFSINVEAMSSEVLNFLPTFKSIISTTKFSN